MGLIQTWVDVYPCEVETKGGTTQLRATKSIVTSNDPPWEFYTHGNVSVVRRKAFCERFTVYEVKMGCAHNKREKCSCPRRKTRVMLPWERQSVPYQQYSTTSQ